MTGVSLYRDGRKGKTFNFIDKHISQFIRVSGTVAYVHLYLGVYDQNDPNIVPPVAPSVPAPTDIQDVLLLENRDRKYSKDIFQMWICYSRADNDFDLKSFGIFLTGDTLFLEAHINDTVALLGRRIMPGDVLELPHERDEFLLDGGMAVNKFYVVEEVTRAAGGYSSTWLPHIWRIKVKPMTGGQEYRDILDAPNLDPFGLETGGTLADALGMSADDIALNNSIVDNARAIVSRRNYETRHLYYGVKDSNPWIFAGDGVPPDGALSLGAGRRFPDTFIDQDSYFLRTDMTPPTLYQFTGTRWVQREADFRGPDWTAADSVIESFVNNSNISTLDDGTTSPEKRPLSGAVKPRADF
jgi:hypothetical protein